ncbi:hypothetical protein QJ133_15905 [Priestia megaterium]|jgi:NADPH:quinone reductase-like Zn-dependent oxidoreductase|uniref:hypothetical protein n=1 Tax=Priestia megaterium TaxID=1404 RepID=UPI00070A8C52|nr:hypothetical protein [Priestia megaterium]KRE10272.1 hypothetical protein ASE46_01525 [Bacillus sp. Root239]MDI3092609.1 hypothetical protein [Priestia megaterium]
MKALLLEGKVKVSEMKVGNIQKPHPAKGKILVKIKATALNPTFTSTMKRSERLLVRTFLKLTYFLFYLF